MMRLLPVRSSAAARCSNASGKRALARDVMVGEHDAEPGKHRPHESLAATDAAAEPVADAESGAASEPGLQSECGWRCNLI